MNVAAQVALLDAEIEKQLDAFRGKRHRDKWKAAILKTLSVVCAALITVLLGLPTSDSSVSAILKSSALVLGATITVINAYDAFFDHRELWVRRTLTVALLHDLWRDWRFYSAGLNEPHEADPNMVNDYKLRLARILEQDNQAWLRLRSANQARHQDAPARDRSPVDSSAIHAA